MLRHTWTYHSKAGEVVGYVKRFESGDGSKIVVPYFEASGGTFKKGGAAVPRPLYAQHKLIEAEAIIVVEGERCAEALVQLGLAATTVCGGAHAVAQADWSVCSKVKRVYLLPDADMPGEVYIENVAQALSTVVPSAVFHVARFQGSSGEDIVDWLRERFPSWDGFAEMQPWEKAEALPLFRDFLKASSPYFPRAEDSEDQRSADRTAQNNEHTARLRAALTFEAVLDKYGVGANRVARTNGYTRCSSPFTKDSNPSFDYHAERGTWHCFATGKGGDIFKLIAELENCSTRGEDWRKVIAIAEALTGIAPASPSPRPTVRMATVTNIATRRPLDLDGFGQQLARIPEDLPGAEALTACEEVLRLVAGSNGELDEFAFDQIKTYFHLTRELMRPFRARARAYRQEMIAAEPQPQQEVAAREELVDATTDTYLSLYPQLMGVIHRDIFSEEAMLYDEKLGKWVKALNREKVMKSRFRRHGEQNGIRFNMDAVTDHFATYEDELEPRLCVTVPPWDTRDRLRELCERVELTGKGGILREHLYDLLCEWHARMWMRLENPEIQNRILIFKGPQGIGKDFWVEEQVGGLGQFAVPMSIEKTRDDPATQLHSGLVMKISEFDRSSRHDVATLKNLLTAHSTNFRKAYDRSAEHRQARCSFIATCNVEDILKDHTGNRRYVIFDLAEINRSVRFSNADKLQVLAQGQELARARYEASEESRRLMSEFIGEATPKSPTQLLLEEWDEVAQRAYAALTLENQMQCVPAPTFAEKFTGFMPNRFAQTARVFEQLARYFGWTEKYVRELLAKAGRQGRQRVSGPQERGFYWRDESGAGELEESIEMGVRQMRQMDSSVRQIEAWDDDLESL